MLSGWMTPQHWAILKFCDVAQEVCTVTAGGGMLMKRYKLGQSSRVLRQGLSAGVPIVKYIVEAVRSVLIMSILRHEENTPI